MAMTTNAKKITLNERGRRSVNVLLTNFTVIEIKEAMDIAFNKINIVRKVEDCFKYACGVLWTQKKNREKNYVK